MQVDAFTDRPFHGNPAAVFVLDAALDEAVMQQVAAELNQSESAFLHRKPDGAFALRWFTPTSEIELCGHATLASAHVLFELGVLGPHEAARFDTLSGRLSCTRLAGGSLIEMDFPALRVGADAPPDGVAAALGVERPLFVGLAGGKVLVELGDAAELAALEPDMGRLRQLGKLGVVVTCAAPAGSRTDFLSRAFFPGYGIDEDPVTGAAHCLLATYWAQKLGRAELVGYQASRRGGIVRMRLVDERCFLGGNAVTVLRGEILTA
jgi:PhzF family phenazine biosynthesis protein